jgi:hypothetical protein
MGWERKDGGCRRSEGWKDWRLSGRLTLPQQLHLGVRDAIAPHGEVHDGGQALQDLHVQLADLAVHVATEANVHNLGREKPTHQHTAG